jgi:FkbH-like protein
VLQIPTKLHELPYLLLKDGLFDTLRITDEDRQRHRLYQGEAQRKGIRREYANIDEYLRSLETVATIHRVRPDEIPRVAQLTQKTNQFNVTTRRYSEQDIRTFVESPRFAVFSLTARDRLGALGLVGVMIFELLDGIGRIDSFLMSCRALGRRLEDAMLTHCLQAVADTHRVIA